MLIKLNKVKKYYGDRLILDIDKLEILEHERIGIVGDNGVGKSTLLKIILGETEPDEGTVFLCESYSYISQNDCIRSSNKEESKLDGLLKIDYENKEDLSGGEKVKLKIKDAFINDVPLLMADEPTANLDINTIKVLEGLISEFRGGLLLVSHDRDFLENLCTSILEIENGKVKFYRGSYSKYLEDKQIEKESKEKEYSKYINEKRRLESAIIGKEELCKSIKKAPKRMGNSEARLHKMGDQRGKKNLDGSIKGLKSRINHLEKREKPAYKKDIKIKVSKGKEISSKNVIDIRNFTLSINERILVDNVNFKIKRGSKVAIVGENGVGKTTLIKAILNNKVENIKISNNIAIGYFDQEQDILDYNKTIFENIKESSILDETIIRIALDGFGFSRDDLYKKCNLLSGGERIKVGLCKILLKDNNTLILDEPTNYLDMKSIVALESAIINTDKTVIIISHDRKFIGEICNCIIEIKDKKINCFLGRYDEFLEMKRNIEVKKHEDITERKNKESILVLNNRLTEIISLLSYEKNEEKKNMLDDEYKKILKKINELKIN